MTLRQTTVYVCPGCGTAVERGDDFVVAREHEGGDDFTLHMHVHELPLRAERRFHTSHFRGRIGAFVYELVEHRTTG